MTPTATHRAHMHLKAMDRLTARSLVLSAEGKPHMAQTLIDQATEYRELAMDALELGDLE